MMQVKVNVAVITQGGWLVGSNNFKLKLLEQKYNSNSLKSISDLNTVEIHEYLIIKYLYLKKL